MAERKAKPQRESVREPAKKEKIQVDFVFADAKRGERGETAAITTDETAKAGKKRARNRLTFRF
jgi:hypothetical protein